MRLLIDRLICILSKIKYRCERHKCRIFIYILCK